MGHVDTEIKALLQQLQVYQSELESQNGELQRAQQELAATLHRYTELYEQAPIGYVTLDARGRITQANHAARAMLQLPGPGMPPVLFTRYAALVEHERMSADIHDGLSQDLAGLSLSLRALQMRTEQGSPPGVADLDGLNAITMAALTSCRDIVRGLSPVGENEGGLVPALRGMVERAGTAKPPAIRFELTGRSLVSVPLSTADHLYRIAQEGLTNARRHGSAREIVLSLDVQRESITLTVADDGCGHDTQRTDAEGMGLRLMQSRANSIGAMLTSESVVGGGTRVRCVCPQPVERS